MSKSWIILYSFYLRIHEGEDFLFYLMVVGLDSLFEIIRANFICKVYYHRYGLIGFHLSRNLCTINYYLCIENLLVDTFVEIIGNSTHKHTLCKVADFGSRDETVHLCGNRGGFVITVDGHRLSLLENLSKSLRKGLGGFSHDLTTEHVAYGILYHFTFFVSIIASKLREILKAQTHRYLVASGSGDQIVQATGVT